MATDADGVTINVGDAVWYDDGHSADWVASTITGFPSAFPGKATLNGVPSPVPIPLIHKNKPINPPDR